MSRKLVFGEVISLVFEERHHQNQKHGSIEDNPHDPATWLLLIEAELREARDAIIKGHKATGRDTWTAELVQVAALCMAALEQHGMQEQNGERVIPRHGRRSSDSEYT